MSRIFEGLGYRRAVVRSFVGCAAFIGALSVGTALAAPGQLITSFGSGGTVVGVLGPAGTDGSIGQGVVVAPNGEIYVGGETESATGDETEMYIARYTAGGTLDPSFGTNGVTVENVGQGSDPATDDVFDPEVGDGGLGIALTPSGNPVIATTATDVGGNQQLAVLEFTQNGQLDTSFADGGYYLNQLSPGDGTAPLAIGVETNGQIVVTGTENQEFFAERLNADGTPDTTFDAQGTDPGVYENQVSLEATDPFSEGTGVVEAANGDLVFTVAAADVSGDAETVLTSLTSNGSVNTAFAPGSSTPGTEYLQSASGVSEASGLAVTSDGGFVVAGTEESESDVAPESDVASETGLAMTATRFNANGTLDTSFGDDGTFTAASADDNLEFGLGVLVQADGRIVLYGLDLNSDTTSASAEILRLTPAGALDTTFGQGGVLDTQVSSGSTTGSLTVATGAALTSDGSMLISGAVLDSTGDSVESYLQELSLDDAPSVSLGSSPASVQTGVPVTFTASASSDDGDAISSYDWDLGSGSFVDATGASATKTFTSPGTYDIRVKVTDADGISTTTGQTITVEPAVSPETVVAKLTLVSANVSGETIKLKLSCASAACNSSVSLTTLEHKLAGKLTAVSARAKKKVSTSRVKVGSASIQLAAGNAATYTLKLNGTGLKLLKHFHKLPVTLSFSGIKSTKQLTIKYVAPKKKTKSTP